MCHMLSSKVRNLKTDGILKGLFTLMKVKTLIMQEMWNYVGYVNVRSRCVCVCVCVCSFLPGGAGESDQRLGGDVIQFEGDLSLHL